MSTDHAPIARLLPSVDLDREDALARAYADGHDDAGPRPPAAFRVCYYSDAPGPRDLIVIATSLPEAISRAPHPERVHNVVRLDERVLLPPATPVPEPALPDRLAVLFLETEADGGRRILAIASLYAPEWRSAMSVHIAEGYPREQFLACEGSSWRSIHKCTSADGKEWGCYAQLACVQSRPEALPHVEVKAAAAKVAAVPPGGAVIFPETVDAVREALSGPPPHGKTATIAGLPPVQERKRLDEEPELDQVEGTVKYVRMESGEVRFLRQYAGRSHSELVPKHERDDVVSAGKVYVDRTRRTVRMDDRDSVSLEVDSRPGDEDARVIERLLFGTAS